jgi:DNA primase
MFEITNILDSILGPHKRYAKGELYYFCPFCNHHNPKLAININKGKWHCWTCSVSGNKLLFLLRKLNASKDDINEVCRLLNEYIPPTDIPSEDALCLPKEFQPLWEPSKLNEYRLAKLYISSRGISEDDILRYQLGYCLSGRYARRIIVPSFDESGTLNYFIGRDYREAPGLKYLNPLVSKNVVCFDYHINWNYPVILTEGMFDAMAIKRNAVPLLGTFVPKKLREKIIKQTTREIYLALDSDAKKKMLDIAEGFLREGFQVFIVNLPEKDPSVIGFAQMQRLIANATPLTFYELIQLRLSMV